MPSKPLRFCAHAGCGELVHGGLCAKHQAERDERDRKARQQADAERGNAQDRGYDGTWQQVRKSYIARHPVCQRCEAMGRTTRAVLVHHVVPISQGGARLDPANLQALCAECHDAVHKGDRWGRGGSNL